MKRFKVVQINVIPINEYTEWVDGKPPRPLATAYDHLPWPNRSYDKKNYEDIDHTLTEGDDYFALGVVKDLALPDVGMSHAPETKIILSQRQCKELYERGETFDWVMSTEIQLVHSYDWYRKKETVKIKLDNLYE